MPGRKARPTAIEERMGRPKKQKKNKFEPKPKPITGAVDPPAWLDDIAQGEWRRVAPKLAELGLLTDLDLPALATFCQSYADFARLSEALADGEISITLHNEDGDVTGVKVRPEWYLRRSAFLQLIRTATEFGMTPSSRGRMNVAVEPTKPKDELMALLDGGTVASDRVQ
jgi:P27 family predicted phage terminase small subunit